MDGYTRMKMKRKELEEVNDDFTDFSLSSPARKIRRLDAQLPPIMEDNESEVPLVFEQSMSEENFAGYVEQGGGTVIEELATVPGNEERAIVLFKPMNTTLLQSPSGFSVSVNPDLISGFKNQVLWSSQLNTLQPSENEAGRRNENLGVTNECLAVVPWVPSLFPHTSGLEVTQTDVSELMEAEEMEAAAMDIEDNHIGIEQKIGNQEFGGMTAGEGLHQWQQHCMIPQPPQNTPIVWFR